MTRRRILSLAILSGSVLVGGFKARGGEFKATYGEIYAQRDDGPLKADVYIPDGDGPFPGVLVVHGGAWRMGSRGQLSGVAQMLAQHGFTAIAISYRLAPAHKFPAQILDCKDAIRWMRTNAARLKIDPERIGGFGYSAGAHLVSLLGTTDEKDGLEGVADPKSVPSTRIQCVACGGAPCDLRPIPRNVDGLSFFLGGSPAQCPEQYRLASPAAFVTPDDPPMFFFHAEDDQLVPLASPTQMRAALVAAGIVSDLYVVPHLGHTAAAMDRDAINRSIAFLAKHLQAEGN
ncbi:alpha/beta hydrolase [Lacipirellula limnantheis]|uniref:Carboxylesterase NlhH n=1 Tax=Lacipirellula limnantheis TaxID=2528024 RepID=A0A517TRD3_9BACT|nr:alpha/beta hydrolase [Lacipirellula limnantheis]QDT70918.1 Carboxylesterase NlhH [Lacipirellula limnantheis]